MGPASVPVGIGAGNALRVPFTSATDQGELDLTTLTGVTLKVARPDGPNGTSLTFFTVSLVLGTPAPTPTAAVWLWNFTGTEFVVNSVDLPGPYRCTVAFVTASGSIPAKEWRTLQVTPRNSG